MKRIFAFLFLTTCLSQTLHARDFQTLKDFFDKSQTPRSADQVVKKLSSKKGCLAYKSNNRSQSYGLEITKIVVKPSAGPAFPEESIKAITFGKTLGTKPAGFQYNATLDRSGLKLETLNTDVREECETYEDPNTGTEYYCTDEVHSQVEVIMFVRLNNNFVTFHDSTKNIYGYCWE